MIPNAAAPRVRRRRQARRACAALLWGAAAAAALQLGLAWAVEAALPQVRDPGYGARVARLRGRLAGDAGRPVVVLGSSRSLFGYQTDRMEGLLSRELGRPVVVANFAVTGGGPATELLTCRRLFKDGVHPDLVLVEVLPVLLGCARPEEMSEQRLPTDRLRRSDLALVERYGGDRAGRVRREWQQGLLNPCYSHRVGVLRNLAPGLVPGDPRGPSMLLAEDSLGQVHIPDDLSDEFRARAMKQMRLDYAAALAGFRLERTPCDCLRAVLGECRRHGAPAALVLMPEGPAYQSLYPPPVWREITDWLAALSQETGAPVFSARDWFGEDAFIDSHHLLGSSGDAFTDRLAREYVAPALGAAAARR
jgi:hypothetical protein